MSEIKLKKPASTVLLMNNKNEFLAVSRKDNHEIFGLIGGKVEDTDPNMRMAAIRETKEETGLDIYDLILIHEGIWNDRYQQTFTAKWKGIIHTNENHVVKWVAKDILLSGPYGEYNKIVFDKLNL